MPAPALTLVTTQPALRTAIAQCTCGGLLAYTAGRWVHADACAECADTPTDQQCRALQPHKTCADPEPVDCDHQHCHEPHQLGVGPCNTGHRFCCGCCQEEDAL
jgi:hypothetical protein